MATAITDIESTLDAAGMPREQGRAIARCFEIARKDQEEDLKGWMRDNFVTRAEFHREMGNLKAELIKWTFLFILGQSTVFLGALYFLYTALKP